MELRKSSGQIIRPSKWRKNKNGKEPYQGEFYPANTAKYEGNLDNITFRSGMELTLMKYLDASPTVLSWSSEEIIIPYVHPVDGKVHRYFPDFKIKLKMRSGAVETWIIEVKESTQTRPPKLPKNKKKTARYLREEITFAINSMKWHYAEEYCAKQGWKFVKWTEKELRF